MNARRVACAVAAALVVSAGFTVAAERDAYGATTAQFVGHRCRTWPTRAGTHENTREAVRQLAQVPGAWCESDLWNTRDNTDFVWHDPTLGGAADQASLAALGLTHATRTDSVTRFQVARIHTKGGSVALTAPDMVRAAYFYGVPRIIFERKNRIGHPFDLDRIADLTGVSVWAYKTPVGVPGDGCVVSIPEWAPYGRIGAKVSSTSRCTAAHLLEQGVTFVHANADWLTENNCARARSFQKRGMAVIVRQPSRATYEHDLRPCGLDRVLVNDVAEAARTW